MTRTVLVRSLVFGFTLTLTGVASARRPPTLVAAQERVEGVFATCPEGRSTAGYRDMLARFDSAAPRTDAPVRFVAPPRKMQDHVVLSCTGGTVHSGSGYRDMLWRFPTQGPPVFARTPSPSTARLVR
jgi:hypothetical protein